MYVFLYLGKACAYKQFKEIIFEYFQQFSKKKKQQKPNEKTKYTRYQNNTPLSFTDGYTSVYPQVEAKKTKTKSRSEYTTQVSPRTPLHEN